MTTRITTQDIARKAVELAEADPTHVYQPPRDEFGTTPGCRYVHRNGNYADDGEPTGYGCLFGQALMQLGVNPDSIPEGNHIAATLRELGITEATAERNILGNPLPGSDPILFAMLSAQGKQDDRQPWGEAIQPLAALLAEQEVAA